MTRMAFFEIEEWERQYFRSAFPDAELAFHAEPLNELHGTKAADAAVISTFINSRLSGEVLEGCAALKAVCTRSTGYDHIDIQACRKRGITVCNVPTYGSRTVAEFTFALILMLAKRMDAAIQRVRQTGSFALDGLRGFDLQGRTLGVVGTGNIGREVIAIARGGFGMNVVASDVQPDAALAARFGFVYVSLERLLASADIITLHVPYLPATRHLIHGENLKHVRRGALLVNTSRGGVVETRGLIEALHSGRLAGAALDVLEEEGLVREERELVLQGHPEERHLRAILENHVLMRMPNVLVTPHNAFNTQEALEEILRVTAENIRGFLAGRPQNTVPG